MTYIGLKVTSPVGSATPPHKHGGAAVVATMIRGRTLNQMVCDGKSHGPRIYSQGESWYEPPGCHHVRNENAGDEEAVFIANFIIETKKIEELGIVNALVQIDAEEEEKRKAQ
jgi:quercetin dioxygenase-like cupin family protein